MLMPAYIEHIFSEPWMAVTAAPGQRSLKSAVLEHFSVLMERKEGKKDVITLLCLAKGSYF